MAVVTPVEVRFVNTLTFQGVDYYPDSVAVFEEGVAYSLVTAGYAVLTGGDPDNPDNPPAGVGGAVATVNHRNPDGAGNVQLIPGDLGAATTAQVTAAKDRSTHTGTQTADTITDGATNKAYTATERSKLAGIQAGATANSTDAQLRDRATHTGVINADQLVDGVTAKVFLASERAKLAALGDGSVVPVDTGTGTPDAYLLDRTHHTGTQPAATISDLTEVVQDIIGATVVQGANTSVVYDDIVGRLIVSSTGGGGTGPVDPGGGTPTGEVGALDPADPTVYVITSGGALDPIDTGIYEIAGGLDPADPTVYITGTGTGGNTGGGTPTGGGYTLTEDPTDPGTYIVTATTGTTTTTTLAEDPTDPGTFRITTA